MTAYSTPTSGYYNQMMADIGSKSAGQNVLGQLSTAFGPTASAYGLEAAGLENQANMIPQQLAMQNAYTNAMAGYQLANLGIAATKLGVQGTGLAERQQLLNTENPLERQEFALQQTEFPEQRAEEALRYQTQLLNHIGSVAQSGVQGSTGAKFGMTQLQQQHGFAEQNINRAQQLSTLHQQGTLAQQQYSTEELGNARQNLALLARANGLSQTEVMTRLNYGLAQNQMGAQQNAMTVLTKLGNVWAGAESGLGNDITNAGFLSGLNLFAPAAASYTDVTG